MAPAQKADMVTVVKKRLGGRVLAIGDGANDVPMLQAAHVGVGVAGREGMQAAMAADFAVSRFAHLSRLLLVHGAWNYSRLARAFLYFLYKNAVFVFVIVVAQFWNGHTAFTPMDPLYMMLYPIIFTAVQPLLFGILDQQASADDLLSRPAEFYAPGRDGKLYTSVLFLANMLEAVWQAVAIYFPAHAVFWDSHYSCWAFGWTLASGMFNVNTAHLALDVRCWTLLTLFVFCACTLLHYVYLVVVAELIPASVVVMVDPPIYLDRVVYAMPSFWAALLLTVIVALLPRLLVRLAAYYKLHHLLRLVRRRRRVAAFEGEKTVRRDRGAMESVFEEVR